MLSLGTFTYTWEKVLSNDLEALDPEFDVDLQGSEGRE